MMKYPIGIQNFEKLRSEGYVYVDKTPRQLLIFTVLIALLFPIGSWAKLNPGDDAATAKAKVMVVTTMDGRKTKLGLKNTPIITIETPYLVYKSDVAEARFELDQLRDIKYEDVVPISGDASGDGVINKADVDETVQYIFGKPSGDFIFSNADTNNDQKVNATDIVQISDLLKNPNINDISKSRSAANSDDQAADSQQHQYALYNYRNDGNFNAWLNLDIDSVTYSRIDTLGVERNAVVVQEVWTPDSLYRIPLEAIDSIGFRAPEPEFASDILYIRDYHAIHTTLIDGLTIHFDNTIHNDSIPSVGQVILSVTESTPYEEGFAGKVIDIKYGSNGVSVICEEVSIGDIYKRLVVVGKVSNDIDLYPSLARAKTRSSDPWMNVDEDGVIPIQLDEKEFSIGDLVKITSPRPKLTCSFYIYISELYYEGYVQLDLYHPDLTYTLSFSLDQLKKYPEFGKFFAATFSTDEELQKWVEEYKNKKIKDYQEEEDEYEKELSKQWFERSKIKIPIPSPYPGIVNFQLEISPIVKAKGKLELDSEFKTDARQSMSMKWKGITALKILSFGMGLPDIPAVSVSAHQDPIKSAKLDLKATGTLTLGFKTLLNVNLVHKDLIYLGLACDAAIEAGGTLDVTFIDTERPEMNVYERLKDTNLKISTYAKGYAEAGTTPYKFLSLSTRKLTLFSDEYLYNIFPHFTKPALPKYNNGTWQGKKPLTFYSSPSKDIYIPCKIGMRIVKEMDNQEDGDTIKEYEETYRYLDEIDWSNKYVNIDVSDLPNGNYKCYPTISFFGWKPFNAGPVHKFTVPLPLVASPSQLNLKVGSTGIVDYFGGWDTFAVAITGDEDIVSFVFDEEKTPRKIKVYAEKVGTTTLQIEDRRTGEKLSVPIIVTDETVTQSTIKVEPAKIDFGTVKTGESKTEHFTVSNTGQTDLKFKVAKASAPFDISEAGKVFTLSAGKSKDFSVTCSGLSPEEGEKEEFIRIKSDAFNASADFGFMLSANGGEAEPEAPYIPVQTETIVVKGVPFTMVAVEGGSFMMGSPDDDPDAGGIYSDEKPQHRVKLSNFAIGQTEVTQALWKVVMGDNPSSHKGYKKPVEWVGWDKCQTFISKLNALTGRTFRLPTEAEWEYAARGGKNSKGYKYAGSNDIDEVAWNINNSEETTHIVGTKKPNELGLYDMSGNVWEWCQDWYDWTYYRNSPEINPCNTTEVTSDDEADHQHIHRGGSISYIVKDLRNAMRGDFKNEPSLYLKGLRLVISDGKKGYKETTADDEAYAAYYNGTLSFYCDGDRFSKSGETYDMPDYKSSPDWRDIRESVKRVIFDSSFAKARPKCTMAWFADMSTITKIEGLQYLNTSQVTFMSEMFYKCSSLKKLDVSHFNTSKVTHMGYIFDECSSLTSLDVSHFNTSKVTNMQSMFRKCSSLTGLDLSNFDTSRTTTMSNLFAGCSNLTTLDVSHFDTSQTTDMYSMFWGCSGLSGIDVSNFNTSKVTNMTWMFGGCSSLKSIDISNFDISGLVDGDDENALQGMFYDCSNLKTIKCGGLWNMKSTANSSDMFIGCTSLVGGKGTKFDSNHTDGEYARIDGGPNSPGYFTSVNEVTPEEKEEIYVTPTEIDFGRVELDTDKTANFTVTNNKSTDVTFSVPYWGDYFEVSDTNEDITLAPGESKVFTITAHGMKRGSQASCEFRINVNTEEDMEKPTVKATLTGWDTKPLTLATNSISLSRGEEKKVEIVYGSLNYELTSDDPHLFIANIADHGRSGGGWYDNYSSTTCFVRIEAGTTAEKATIRVKDKDTGEEVALQVTIDAVD